MPLVFNMSWIVCAYPTAKLRKIYGITAELQQINATGFDN